MLHSQGFNERGKRKTAAKLKSFDIVLTVNLLLHKNVAHVKSGLQPGSCSPLVRLLHHLFRVISDKTFIWISFLL